MRTECAYFKDGQSFGQLFDNLSYKAHDEALAG